MASRTQNWLKGKKTYLALIALCAFALFNGQLPEGSEEAIGGFDPEAIETALWGAVVGAIKAAWNRQAESN